MPKYRFQWANLPSSMLESLAPDAVDPRAVLRAKYGARPKEEFVQDHWRELRDGWLVEDEMARAEVIERLVAAGVGTSSSGLDSGSQFEFLRGLRNAKTLRSVVLDVFHRYGENPHDSVASPQGDDLDRIQRPWITQDLSNVDAAGELRDGVLALLAGDLQMDAEWVTRSESTLRWWGGPVPMTIETGPARLVFDDPTVKVVCSVTIATDVKAPPSTVLEMLDLTNRLASVGAFLWIQDLREVRAFTTFYVHEDNESVTHLLPLVALLVYSEALGRIGAGLPGALQGQAAIEPHPVSGPRSDLDEMLSFTDGVVIPKGQEPCAWQPGELDAVAQMMIQSQLTATGGGGGMSVEFPFSSCVPAVLRATTKTAAGGLTSLYQQGLEAPHPGYHNGLFSLLRLPVGGDADSARTMANSLNGTEWMAFTGTPSWGAWCSASPEGGLAHVAFLPNVVHRNGLAETLSFYEYMRSQWVQEQLLPIEIVREVRAGRR